MARALHRNDGEGDRMKRISLSPFAKYKLASWNVQIAPCAECRNVHVIPKGETKCDLCARRPPRKIVNQEWRKSA